MATPQWQAGGFYNPGDLVRRVSAAPVSNTQPANPNFEQGVAGWLLTSGFTIEKHEKAFNGPWALNFDDPGPQQGDCLNTTIVPVSAGQSIKAQIQVALKTAPANEAGGRVIIQWLDINQAPLSVSEGELVQTVGNSASTGWKASTLTAVAPANAYYAQFGVRAFRQGGEDARFDAALWDYAYSPSDDSLIFRAVQPNAGFSGATEPDWPNQLGQQVIDNEVIWEATDAVQVTWEARPILVSGAYEPDFSDATQPGSTVSDNTIIWEAVTRRVEDEKCPNTKYVVIAASKVFCADTDIIAFSATVNPLDWTTEDNAGYLPFGLQTYGSQPVRALGLYRGNLTAFNALGFQMWQVDEDPANMALLDRVPVGTIYYKGLQSASNDMVVVTPTGIRNLGIAAASTNLQAGDFGDQVDPIVKQYIKAYGEPWTVYWPNAGQFWAIWGTRVLVLSLYGAKKMKWSRYEFPEALTDATVQNGDLYLRTATHKVWKMDEDQVDDDHFCSSAEFDMPYQPEDLSTGTLTYDANYVLDRRNVSDFGDGPLTPDSYGGSTPDFETPVRAMLVMYIFDLDGVSPLTVRVTGELEGQPVTEDLTLDSYSGYHYIVGDKYFDRIDEVEQLTPDQSDLAYSVGVQEYVPDEDADELTVTVHGALAVANNASSWNAQSGSSSTVGLFPYNDVIGRRDYPAAGVLLVRHNANTTTAPRTYTLDGGAGVVLPAGSVGRVIVGTDEAEHATEIIRTGSGGSTPSVDFGVRFTVAAGCTGEPINAWLWWPFLDFNSFGVEKQMIGFDVVCDAPEGVTVSVGYDQTDRTARTEEYEVQGDTMVGDIVPLPVAGASFDLRITFNHNQAWEWQAANIYVQDFRLTS